MSINLIIFNSLEFHKFILKPPPNQSRTVQSDPRTTTTTTTATTCDYYYTRLLLRTPTTMTITACDYCYIQRLHTTNTTTTMTCNDYYIWLRIRTTTTTHRYYVRLLLVLLNTTSEPFPNHSERSWGILGTFLGPAISGERKNSEESTKHVKLFAIHFKFMNSPFKPPPCRKIPGHFLRRFWTN